MHKPTLDFSNFAVYLASFWKVHGHKQIPDDTGIHLSIAEAFNRQRAQLEEECQVKFLIIPSPAHGASQTVADMFASLHGISFISYVHPHDGYARLSISKENAVDWINRLPERLRQVIREIAREAIANYRKAAV